jgi:hypothetical protein
MEQDNRVLGRIWARELTPRETKAVTGALGTQTTCTFDEGGFRDGDTGEC